MVHPCVIAGDFRRPRGAAWLPGRDGGRTALVGWGSERNGKERTRDVVQLRYAIRMDEVWFGWVGLAMTPCTWPEVLRHGYWIRGSAGSQL